MKIYWDGRNKNIIGAKVRQLRLERKMTQKQLAARLQLDGHEFSDLTVLRIESGKRFVADYELKALAKALGVSYSDLLD
jgi:transcriptional regulator with XRE-family HTH domain